MYHSRKGVCLVAEGAKCFVTLCVGHLEKKINLRHYNNPQKAIRVSKLKNGTFFENRM